MTAFTSASSLFVAVGLARLGEAEIRVKAKAPHVADLDTHEPPRPPKPTPRPLRETPADVVSLHRESVSKIKRLASPRFSH